MPGPNPAERSLYPAGFTLFPALLLLLVRQVVDEERRFFIPKLSVTLRGGRPRALRGAARRGKRTGEAGRVLPAGHKSAEPVKAGRPGTSDPDYGPASVSVMERETEPMADAPLRGTSPMRKWARRSQDLWSAGAHSRGGNRGCPRKSSTSLRESLQGPRAGFRTGCSRLLPRTKGYRRNLRTLCSPPASSEAG